MTDAQTAREQLVRENEALRHQVAALAAEAEGFKAILCSIGDAVISADGDGHVLQMNPVAEALTGWSEVEAKGRPTADVFKVVNEETRVEAESPVARVLREGVVVGLADHSLLVAKDGTERPVAGSGAPIRGKKDAVTGAVLVFRDHTEEQAAQRALAESEDELRTRNQVFEDSIASQSIADKDGLITHVNQAFLRLWGYADKERATGKSVGAFFANPADATPVLAALAAHDAWEGEFLARRTDGSTFVSRGYATSLRSASGELIGYQSTNLDVTRERESEQALRESEERSRTTLRSIGDGVIATDAAGRITQMNTVAQMLTGWGEAETIGQPLARVFHIVNEETRAEVESPVERVLREGLVVGLANHTVLIAKDGTERPIADSGAPIRNAKGDIVGVVLVFRDQTDERAAQRALRDSERKFRDAVTFLDEGYYACAVDGVLQHHNVAFNRILGFDPAQDLKGSKLPDFWQNPDDRKAYLSELMSTGVVRNFLINAKTIAGDKLVAMANSHLVKDDNGVPVGIQGTFTDFTEPKRMEEALTASEEKYRSLFDNAEVGMYRSRIDGSGIVALNQCLADMFGYTKEEMTSTPATIRWADPKARDEMLRLLRPTGELRNHEIDILTKSGETRTSLTSIRLFPGEGFLEGTALDITERKRMEERVHHLNLVLSAIRDVNQLIVREKDAGTLIRRCCEVLTETRGYVSAWIALHDDSGQYVAAASAGLGDALPSLASCLESHSLPCAQALQERGVHVIKNPATDCPACPAAVLHTNQSAIAVRLEHEGKVYGLLVMAMDRSLVDLVEEQRLIEEVADDIAYALHGLEVETGRSRAKEDLRRHRDELEQLVERRTRELAESRQRLVQETAAVAEIVGEMLSGALADAETERQVLDACLDATGSMYGMIGAINQHGKYDVTTYNGQTLGDCAFPEALAWEMTTGMDIRGIWGWPMVHGESLLCNNLPDHPDRVGQPKGHVPIECFLGVPVKSEGKVSGMVAVANRPGGYTEADEQTLVRLVDVMTVSRRYRGLLTELERRVSERTARLEEANQELEAFSYSVSHDLRAPLRAIDGFTRMLVDGYEPQLNTEGRRLCSVIRANTHKMSRLIDDLLAFSRLGRAEMSLSRIDMQTLASSIFHELTTPESRMRIDFQVGSVPAAVADPTLIRQVWTNLLSNAIKFSARRERALIRVSARRSEDECVYAVQDDGAGFDMHYVHKLFGVFQRLHSTKEFEGNGVGLALVQRVIRRHGGRVWAEGEPDRGATFYFALKHTKGA